jgi:two-component system phosphate regulon response regulator PhoB
MTMRSSKAENGDIGLAMATTHLPDLVLLDVMMPGTLNGLDVCRALKARANPARVCC